MGKIYWITGIFTIYSSQKIQRSLTCGISYQCCKLLVLYWKFIYLHLSSNGIILLIIINNNNKKIVTLQDDVELIVNTMQKSVISSCTILSRRFKIQKV